MAPYTFQFGFEGDDIEEDPTEEAQMTSIPEGSSISDGPPQREPKVHSLEDMVCGNFLLFVISRPGNFSSKRVSLRVFHRLC